MNRFILTSLILGGIFGGAAALVACSPRAAHAPAGATSVYEVSEAEITKIPGANGPAKAGVTIQVSGLDAELVSVSSAQAKAIEIHTMEMDGSMMKMRLVESLPVTEQTPLRLGGHGAHLMVFGLSESLKPGDPVDLLLTLRNAEGREETLAVEARVQVIGE